MDGKKIYYHRTKRGLTQKEASDGICSISYLSKIENNSIVASPEILELLCERLHIDSKAIDDHYLTELKVELKNWLDAIKYRNEELITQKYFELLPIMENVDDVGVVTLYQITLARYYLYKHLLDQADQILSEISAFRKFESIETQYFFHQCRALYAEYTNKYDDAFRELKKAFKLYKQGNFKDSDLLYHASILSAKLGFFQQSLLYAKEALEDFDARANYKKSLECHVILGIAYTRINEFVKARFHYHTALKAVKMNPSFEPVLPLILHNLGHSYFRSEEYEKAIPYLKESYEKKQGENTEGTINVISRTYYAMNDIENARKWLEKGLEHAQGKELFSNYIWLKVLEFQMDQKEYSNEFQQFLEDEATPFLEKNQDRVFLLYVYETLAHYYTEKHMYKNANIYYSKLNGLYKEYI
ncbi:transcriptional activator [Fictibacillus macauensis ZFHKF-1]|uniref:Transcriptional activator n=1 Tax=Fictibacillus macauensis ZFHKF-1 TaxID=1196324 RepID=I8J610_9BACL|nr:tetratricopeptide repeat protein [Fictibacillus macauensis]EIT87241.1 transcriptional activator [Fictibacillus macauensis ZFHKF-1]